MIQFYKTARNIGRLVLAAFVAISASYLQAQTSATSQVVLTNNLANATGVAVDSFGNVYYADGSNNTLQQIRGANGPSTLMSSTLSSPGQVALDLSQNLYVANGSTNVVYEYTYSNGAYNLNTPVSLGNNLGTVTGVAIDLSGNIYIVDAGKKQVVKISGSTQTTLLTGLSSPRQIAVDRAGGIYVADAGANAIIYLPSGGTQQSIGTGLNAPSGVAVDTSNNLYIADTGNSAIKEIPYSSGPVTASQTTLPVTVTTPYGIAVDSRGSLYVAAGSSVSHISVGAIYFGLIEAAKTTQVVPITLSFQSAVSPASIKVVTTGLTGLDFKDAGGGTCTAGNTYAAGSSCTVNVSFTPAVPGPRYGAIVFYDSSNRVVSRTYIGGGGIGPMLTFDPGVISSVIPVQPTATLYPNNANTNPYPIALSQPHGARFDAAGNLFMADTGTSRVVEFPANATAPIAVSLGSTGLDDVAIDGAGDFIVPDLSGGRVILVPYENGTWNFSDVTVLGSGYTKPRTVGVDIAGNAFTCDTGGNKIYKITPSAVQTQIQPGLTTACLGVAVDLYGNLGVADSTGKTVYYIPVNGQAPYSIGNDYTAPWAVAFDASGSLYVTDNGAAYVYRIPNENGKLTLADREKMTGNKNYSFAIDPYGNLVTTPLVGTSVPTSGYNFNVIARSAPTPFTAVQSIKFGAVAVGSTGTSSALTIANAGNETPTYTNGGFLQLGDTNDFSLTATVTSPPVYPVCNFSNALQPGAACYVGVAFTPTSPGVLRTEYLNIPTQGPWTPQSELYGTSSGTPVSGSTNLTLAVTSPTSAPNPGQPITVTATAPTSATGAVTFYVDGVGYNAAALSQGTATFSIPSGLTAGSHTVGATYAGDKNNAPVTTPVTIQVNVVKATPTLSIAAAGAQLAVGQSDTFTGTVNAVTGLAAPTGTLTFYDGSTAIGTATISNNIASLSVSTLALGTHTIKFTYNGDATYTSATSGTVSVVVGNYIETSTTMVVTPSQPVGGYSYGTAITATATVTPQSGTAKPTGNIQFSLDGAIQSVSLNNNTATITYTPHAGTHVLTASYSGDTTFSYSGSSTSFTTIQAVTVTTLNASSTAVAAGSNVTLTANVTSPSTTPTGSVTFKNGVIILGTATLTNGSASITTPTLPAGVDQITAVYAGDSDAKGSSSAVMPITVTINQTALSVIASPVVVFQAGSTSLIATVANNAPSSVALTPSGLVTYYANGVLLATSAVGTGTNTASYSWKPTTAVGGIITITASYAGDNYYAPSSTTSTYRMYVEPTSGWSGSYTLSIANNPLNISIGTPATTTITAVTNDSYFGYVQFSCTGLPANSNCVMTPNQITMDGTTTPRTVTLTIVSQAPGQIASISTKSKTVQLCGVLFAPLLSGLFLCSFARGRKALRSIGTRGLLMFYLLAILTGSVSACGNHPATATTAGTYTVKIIATGSGGVNASLDTQMTFK